MKKTFFLLLIIVSSQVLAQKTKKILASTPPMGWMTWNYFGTDIHEKDIMEMADAMVSSGMLAAGYNYVFIDDGWVGGRDNRNNIIADPVRFPSGIKAMADYVHARGLKLGIYSDASPVTCEGYTASLNFEEQDAKTFAEWGVDYLKYDYCSAPEDLATAKKRYKTMADALKKSGREIVFGICEWGMRKPWFWAEAVGGQLWRTTGDIRDKWINIDSPEKNPFNWNGILNTADQNAGLYAYASPGHWNDMDMLLVGLYGRKGPSSTRGGIGCNDTEYQTQMSLWCMMASPLAASNDIRNMNEATKNILMNKEIIALNQDALGKQAIRKINNVNFSVYLKTLENGEKAVAIVNKSPENKSYNLDLKSLSLYGNFEIRDLWQHVDLDKANFWKGTIASHETKVFRLKKK
jgi:alpha-galactosidase